MSLPFKLIILMKLHLPQGLRKALLACFSIAATLSTTVYAADYTVTGENQLTTGGNLSSVSLTTGDVLTMQSGATITNVTFASDNAGVTLKVDAAVGDAVCSWNPSATVTGAGISRVELAEGGVLQVNNPNNQYPAFNKQNNATLDIVLGRDALLIDSGRLFGWDNNNSSNGGIVAGQRTLTMNAGSIWRIHIVGGANDDGIEWLNKTDVTMAAATIDIVEGCSLAFERSSNSITVAADAESMSRIMGAGSLKMGNHGVLADGDYSSYNGYLFTVNRGNFNLDDTNTADLQISAAIVDGGEHNFIKAGNGTLELTNTNSGYSKTFYVTAGELKLTGAGQAGTGAVVVSNGATFHLAHSEATTVTNAITLQQGGELKVGANHTLSGTSSLLGTITLFGEVVNTGTITLGETTVLNIAHMDWDGTGSLTLFSGSGLVLGADKATVTGYELGEGERFVLSSNNGTTLLTILEGEANNLYWDGGDGEWSSSSTYSDGSQGGISANVGDTIIFNSGETLALSLASDISNPVQITDNTKLNLTLTHASGEETTRYNLTGAVSVASGSTLAIQDNLSNTTFNTSVSGDGRVELYFGTGGHNGYATLPGFNGELVLSGNFNLLKCSVGANATYVLSNGQSWSYYQSDAHDITNNVRVEGSFTLRPDGYIDYTFTGVVTGAAGAELHIGHSANPYHKAVHFKNASSRVENVYVDRGSVVYDAPATNNAVFFTGNTHVGAGATARLEPTGPTGTKNALQLIEARTYQGAIYLNGTASSTATLLCHDGTVQVSGGVHVGRGAYGTLLQEWDKQQFVNGLYGQDATLVIKRNNHNGSNGNARYVNLIGSGDFTGTVVLDNAMQGSEANPAEFDDNAGLVVLGADISRTALQGAVIDFSENSASKAALAFTSSTERAPEKAQLNPEAGNETFSKVDGVVAGLNGTKGSVYAATLTISTTGEASFGGDLNISKLVVTGSGKQILTGAYADSGFETEVQGGILELGTGSSLGALTLSGGVVQVAASSSVASMAASGGSLAFDLVGGDSQAMLTLGSAPDQVSVALNGGTAGETYQLFAGENRPANLDISLADRSLVATYDAAAGTVTLADGGDTSARSLVWNSSSNDGVWSADGTRDWLISGGDMQSNFANGDSVTFGAGSSTISVEGTVAVASMAFTAESGDYTLIGGNIELGADWGEASPTEEQRRVFTKEGDGTVTFKDGTFKLMQDVDFRILGGEVVLDTEMTLTGQYKQLRKYGAGTLVVSGTFVGGATGGPDIHAYEGNVLFTSSLFSDMLGTAGRLVIEQEGVMIGLGGRGEEDSFISVHDGRLTPAADAAATAVVGNLYLDKTGTGTTIVNYASSKTGGATVFRKLVGSGTGDDGVLVLQRRGADSQNVWNIALRDDRQAGDELFHGTLRLLSHAWYASSTNPNCQLTVESEQVLSQAVVEIGGAGAGGGHVPGPTELALGSSVVRVAGLASYSSVSQDLAPGGTTPETYNTDGANTRVTLASGTAAATLLINTAEGTSYDFQGKVAAGISLEKTGKGSQTFSGDLAAFNGNISLQGGTLKLGNGEVTVGAGQTLSLGKAGATLDNALTLNGGTLHLDLAGEGMATSLNGHALTLGGGTALRVDGMGEIDSSTEQLILSGVSRLAGTGGSELTGDINLNDYFDVSSLSAEYRSAQLVLRGSDLYLTFAGLETPEWTWEGTDSSHTWISSNASAWKAESGSPDGQDVYFDSSAANKNVEISGTVAPANIYVRGGDYTFTAAAGSAGISTSGNLTVSGVNTRVQMNLDNAQFTGRTILDGGTLVLGAANALGTSSVQFNGGTLSYASGITPDISAQISAESTGVVNVEVQGSGDRVTWANGTGVGTALDKGITKTGAGTLSLAGTGAHAGVLTVSEGALVLSGNGYTISSDSVVNGTLSIQGNDGKLTGALSGNGHIVYNSTEYASNYTGLLSGDNSNFTGRISILGAENYNATGGANIMSFQRGNSMGSGTVEINGSLFSIQSGTDSDLAVHADLEIGAHGAAFYGTKGKTFTFAKALKGNGMLQTNYKYDYWYNLLFTGDLSQFQGSLTANYNQTDNNAVTYTFGNGNAYSSAGDDGSIFGEGAQLAGNLQASGNNNRYVFNYSNEVAMNAVVTGKSDLRQSGAGLLVITSSGNTAAGTLTIDAASGGVHLGTAEKEADWSGSTLAGGGTFTLVNGTLNSAVTDKGGSSLVVNAAAGKTVHAGGTAGSMLDGITLAQGSTLTGVVGDITVGSGSTSTLALTLDTANVGAGQAGTAMIDQGEGTLTIVPGDNVQVTLSLEAVAQFIKDNEDQKDIWLTLTTGTLDCADLDGLGLKSYLEGLGIKSKFVQNADAAAQGSLMLSSNVSGLYQVNDSASSNQDTVTSFITLSSYEGVVLSDGKTLKVNLDPAGSSDPAVVNNLYGTDSQTGLEISNTNQEVGTVQVDLNYTDINGTGKDGLTMAGSISAGSGVDLHKTGDQSLTVEGDMTVADSFSLDEGELVLKGKANSFGSASLGQGKLVLDENSHASFDTLTLTGAELEVNGIATVGSLADDDAGSAVSLAGTLELTGEGELNASSIIGACPKIDESGAHQAAVLDVQKDASLVLGANAHVEQVMLNVDGRVDIGTGANHSVCNLAGAGTLEAHGGVLALQGHEDSTFSGTLSGEGTLELAQSDKTVTLDNVNTEGAGWNLVNNGTNLLIDLTRTTAENPLSLGSVSLNSGAVTWLLNTDDMGDSGAPILALGSLSVSGEVPFLIESVGDTVIGDGEFVLGTVNTLDSENVTVETKGNAFNRISSAYLSKNEQGELVLVTQKSDRNDYAASADTPNSQAGAELVWNITTAGKDMKGLDSAIYHALNDAGDKAEANRLLAAAAGASTATMGMAFSSDVERQLRAIRNRTTTMGVDECVVHEEMPYFNAWINAEGDYRRMEAKESALDGGYKLNSWGGTVGFDVDATPNLTFGLALTAMYGDFTAEAADQLEGDLDTYYISAFARYSRSSWVHTFVATIGRADVSMERTVSYGAGSYKMEDETNGTAFGLMYEAGYTVALDEDASVCLQPVFNAAYRHVELGSYSETGSDAGLSVGDQTMDVVTFGLGARLQAAVGESIYNRTSILEARALLKVDAGDRRSEADVALLSGGPTATVRSAEQGAVGGEFGAGLTIPVGQDGGALFFDASVELRADYANVNGTLGYRINF